MTVRWKPLLILSVVFVAVALGGLVAFTLVRTPRGTAGLLAKARAERQTKRFDESEILYRQALQVDGRDPAIRIEFAELYRDWAKDEAPEKAAKHLAQWRAGLGDAAKYGPNLAPPRLALLQDALAHDEMVEAARFASELLKIDPTEPTSHYVLAADQLDEVAPNVEEVKRHLAIVAKANPRPVRADWLAARVAQIGKSDAELKAILKASREIREAKGLAPVDAMALFRLRALDVETDADMATLADRVRALNESAEALTADAEIAPARIGRISFEMERVQKSLGEIKAEAGSPIQKQRDELTEKVESASETIFKKALAVKGGADLGVYFAYADHLRFRDKRSRCVEVIEEAFKSPAGAAQGATDAALRLHALAVHAVMTDPEDAARFDKAAPHVKALLDGPNPRFRAFGHMYQGQAELEKITMATAPEGGAPSDNKARTSALNHLKIAANELPEIAEAQARYGVGLILSRETEMGRVYLQRASTLGRLEPRYQIWAAWSMVHGGYPEYAEPIVNGLLREVQSGALPKEMAGILHLVDAEIHQSKRSPEELSKAIASYQQAFANGQKPTATVQLRLAQIELMLNRPEEAMTRLTAMDKAGQGGPGCELLMVNTLLGLKKDAEARDRLKKARERFPRSGELLSRDAEILVVDGKADAAEKLVADFLKADPDNITLIELRASILADALNRADDARALLTQAADRSERTSPLVRLAQIDIKRGNYDGAAVTIAKIRNRWKDAAIGDMLDAQVAIERKNFPLATTYYEAALKKDPSNKMLQFFKAQLDGRTDPIAASKVLESLAQSGSMKEVNEGISLTKAAQSALANIQLEGGDVEGAIARYQDLLKNGGTGGAARSVRWKLVAANVAKRQWPAARAEIEAILADKESPVAPEDRIAAAIYYRNFGEAAVAERLIEEVLAAKPDHPWAVTVRTQLFVAAGKYDEARAIVKRAIASAVDKATTPPAFFLLLAGVENASPPVADGLARALAAVDQGLAIAPGSIELAQAKCRLLGLMGKPKDAVAFVESKMKDDKSGAFARLLISVHSELRDYAAAEKVTADLVKQDPADEALAVALVRLVASRSIEANGRGDRATVETLNSRCAGLIRDFRAKFPNDPTFVQLDCELAVRRGETPKALALTQEIDKMAKTSPIGSLLRARIYAESGRTSEVAAAYNEALDRNPRQPEVRLMLAQTVLKLGEYDEAIRQAKLILSADPDQVAASLVQARAMAASQGSPSQVAANRAAAIELLGAILKKQPTQIDAHHLLAEIHLNNGSRELAVSTLEAGLKAVPADANGLAIAVRILGEPEAPGKPAGAPALARARALADLYAGNDTKGMMSQAASVGLHRAGQLKMALPWGEKAASLTDSRTVHHNFGDLLLSIAESTSGAERDGFLARALAEYDRLLKEDANDVGAVNNKAWVLHAYLKRSQEALDLAEGLARRADSRSLPAEFHDTLGAIQHALGHDRDAEESFKLGLAKAPEMAVLNYHMGKLIAADATRGRKAATYLEKAKVGRDQLSPEMVADLASLSEKLSR